jgi:hypothetical protein
MKFQAPTYPKGDSNRYCGPAVISAVTGLSTGEAARLIRSLTGKKMVTGVSDAHMARAFQACGICMASREMFAGKFRPTLAAWLAKPRDASKVFLVAAGNHWQIIRGRRFVDGIARAVVPLDNPAVKRRARVATVYELFVFPGNELEKPAQAIKPPAALRPVKRPWEVAEAKAGREFRKLAKLHDADWEGHPTRDVGPPFCVWGLHDLELDDDEDPYAGDHGPDDWSDALQRLKSTLP